MNYEPEEMLSRLSNRGRTMSGYQCLEHNDLLQKFQRRRLNFEPQALLMTATGMGREVELDWEDECVTDQVLAPESNERVTEESEGSSFLGRFFHIFQDAMRRSVCGLTRERPQAVLPA